MIMRKEERYLGRNEEKMGFVPILIFGYFVIDFVVE